MASGQQSQGLVSGKGLPIAERYQCFPADGFNEAIDNFRNEFGPNFRPSDYGRVTLHAGFPNATLLSHGRNRTSCAKVVLVLESTQGNLLHHILFDQPIEVNIIITAMTVYMLVAHAPIEYSEIRCSTSR
jgi:hypothetical protein